MIASDIEKNPWLIVPAMWILNKAEARVATWIKGHFGLSQKNVGDDDRVDFFCVAVGGTLHIVEIKPAPTSQGTMTSFKRKNT